MEEWKDIVGYEDLYQISDEGRLKSKYYNRIRGCITSQDGYYVAQSVKNKTRKAYSLHRLVALHFIPNPNNYPQVNHLDFNKKNNAITNLEWCTPKQNCQHRSSRKLNREIKLA